LRPSFLVDLTLSLSGQGRVSISCVV
jgi:hypothetical protein